MIDNKCHRKCVRNRQMTDRVCVKNVHMTDNIRHSTRTIFFPSIPHPLPSTLTIPSPALHFTHALAVYGRAMYNGM